jgi:hypothetical protein
LEQILQVALNGPSLEEFIDSGMMKEALRYFFSKTNRNAKAPAKYIDHFLKQKLEKLVWGTHFKYPNRNGPSKKDVRKALSALSWPQEEEGEEEDGEEFDADEAVANELDKLEKTETEKQAKRAGKRKRAPKPVQTVEDVNEIEVSEDEEKVMDI